MSPHPSKLILSFSARYGRGRGAGRQDDPAQASQARPAAAAAPSRLAVRGARTGLVLAGLRLAAGRASLGARPRSAARARTAPALASIAAVQPRGRARRREPGADRGSGARGVGQLRRDLGRIPASPQHRPRPVPRACRPRAQPRGRGPLPERPAVGLRHRASGQLGARRGGRGVDRRAAERRLLPPGEPADRLDGAAPSARPRLRLRDQRGGRPPVAGRARWRAARSACSRICGSTAASRCRSSARPPAPPWCPPGLR